MSRQPLGRCPVYVPDTAVMKIAQVSPLIEAVPPKLYGGTERVVSNLCEELVAMGHDVTLFASGDSVTSARLAAACPTALRLDKSMTDHVAPHISMLEALACVADEFDVVHLHVDYLGYPILRRLDVPFLSTLHGRLDLPELRPLYEIYRDVPVVSISASQREPLPHANYIGTVYHGLPLRMLSPGRGDGGYLAFLGRVSPEKGLDAAIRIAGRTGLPLKVAAKIDRADRAYYEEVIEPMLGSADVSFVGEIGDDRKSEFLGGAAALLFPIAWREPFGLVMIEAMACGTPVIATPMGSVPEIIEDGVTGFIVSDEDEAVAAAKDLHSLDRARVRREFERRFTSRRMAEDYLDLYRRVIAQKRALQEAV